MTVRSQLGRIKRRLLKNRKQAPTRSEIHDSKLAQQARSATESAMQSHVGEVDWPRVLVFDASGIGGDSATGQLLSTEFRGWPAGNFLQFSSSNSKDLRVHRTNSANRLGSPIPPTEARQQIDDFQPELVFFRPDQRSLPLGELWDSIDDGSLPLAVNVVDDWLRRLDLSADPQAADHRRTLEQLASRAGQGWAISRPMADQLGADYGLEFDVMTNMIDALDWANNGGPAEGAIRFRYSGWPADSKGGESLAEVGRAVAEMHADTAQLEIRMPMSASNKVLADEYRSLANTSVNPWLERDKYRFFLSGAGVNVVTFDFDPTTVGYLKNSFANRIPDLVGAGRPVLVIGPTDLLSVQYLRSAGAITVGDPDPAAIHQAVVAITQDPERLEQQAAQISAELPRFDAAHRRPHFHLKLRALARGVSAPDGLETDPLAKAV